MKYTIVINQVGIVKANLHTKTDSTDWAIIEYIQDWLSATKKNTLIFENREMVWINYSHLSKSLPFFTKLKYTPNISKRFKKLKALNLIVSTKIGDDIYARLTDLAVSVKYYKEYSTKEGLSPATVIKSITPTVIKSITNKSTKRISKVSKDTKGESKKQDSLLKRSFGNRCVKVWNKFPFTVTHRSPTIIKTIDLFMKELIQGTFLENKSISKEYFKRHKISLNGKQYTKTRLLQGIRNVALYSKQGYPDLRTKDLSSLIYNDRTGTSVFLSVLASPPKPLSEERPINDSNQRITDLFIDLFEIHNDTDKVRLVDGIKSLVKYQEKIKLRIPKMHRLYGTPYKLCKTYCEWIGMQEWVDTIHIGMIRADGKMFKKFIEDQEEDCWGYSLVPERRVK